MAKCQPNIFWAFVFRFRGGRGGAPPFCQAVGAKRAVGTIGDGNGVVLRPIAYFGGGQPPKAVGGYGKGSPANLTGTPKGPFILRAAPQPTGGIGGKRVVNCRALALKAESSGNVSLSCPPNA